MKLVILFLSAIILLASGCTTVIPQQNVNLDFQAIPKQQKIGLYVSPIPKISTSFPGAGCLLCIGVASAANSSLTKQVETYQASELAKTAEKITKQLQAHGYEVVKIDTLVPETKLPKIKATPGSTITKDYSVYKTKHGIDQLMVVNFNQVGVSRNYASYVPQGGPHAQISGQFYMLDLANNNYSFYSPINITKTPDGEWDAPPTFANVTNAFYQAEEESVDFLAKPFK